MGTVRSSFSGSDFQYISRHSSIPSIKIEFVSRLHHSASDLGPCRRLHVHIPCTFEPRKVCTANLAASLSHPFGESLTGASSIECPSHAMRPSTCVLESVRPVFREGSYCLDFGTSEALPSVRNFQLQTHNEEKVFEFFKTGENIFCAKWAQPMSATDVICLAIASVERKLCTQ